MWSQHWRQARPCMLEEWKLQREHQYKKFLDRYSEETAMFICGKEKDTNCNWHIQATCLINSLTHFSQKCCLIWCQGLEIFRRNLTACSESLTQNRCLRILWHVVTLKFVPLFSTLDIFSLRKSRKASLISAPYCVSDSANKRQTI